MSERENDDEIEEEEILDHWSHDEHPLSLMETHDMRAECYGCGERFSSGERAYGCSSKKKCGYTKLLHQECAEMPRKITLSEHKDNQHVLILQHAQYMRSWCPNCYKITQRSIGYKCTSSACGFELHMRCARAYEMMEAVDGDDDRSSSCTIHHPNHSPNDHQLMFVERRSSFKCDACGITRRGKSYICTSCRYWIHERCATLPLTIKREDHSHSLSLSYHVPSEYLRYKYKCEVCNKVFLFSRYWIYHCELCRYAVHIKCAFKIKTTISNATNEKGIVRFPTDDVAEELIRPFVMRQGGEGITPAITLPLHDDDDDEMVNVKKYKFILHEHELTLISTSPSHHRHHHKEEKGEEEEDSDEDEEEDWGKRSELICDGCITPILPPSSDKSSSSSYYYSYMSCGECKYNLHLACFNLPPRLPSLPLLHNEAEHELVLISCPQHKPWKSFREFQCSVCYYYTDGLMYSCSKCRFKADIKCASLSQTIHHAAHPQQLLRLITPQDIASNNLSWRTCSADCNSEKLANYFCYADSRYEFTVCVRCTVLPASVRSRRWDRHHPRMPLTYDANINHPGEFYCDECETEMNPKSWMYHCRLCDLSFHPKCFKITSGGYRNRKFEQEYSIPKAHPHTLTYQLLTTKRRCNNCGGDRYEMPGFHCASCNFFICFDCCGKQMDKDGRIQSIDCTNI